ncbi:hypothetical protein ACQ4PT_018514 [Festuca glaucescens]
MAGADVDVGTELRLGLPGGGAEAAKTTKRGYEDTIDLKLTLPTGGSMKEDAAGKPEQVAEKAKSDPEKPPAPKAQAVGWPPVRSYRRNAMTVQSVKIKKDEETYCWWQRLCLCEGEHGRRPLPAQGGSEDVQHLQGPLHCSAEDVQHLHCNWE